MQGPADAGELEADRPRALTTSGEDAAECGDMSDAAASTSSTSSSPRMHDLVAFHHGRIKQSKIEQCYA
jgi:hypothetical protein